MTAFWAKLRRGAELVAAAMFAAMFGTFILQVFTRYAVGRPLQWSLEFDLMAYIWIVFWTAAFLVRERDHISFNLLYDSAKPPVRRVLAIAGTLMLGLTFVAALPGTYDFVTFMRIESTPVIRWRLDFVFAIFVVFMIAVVARSALQLVRLFGRDWPTHI